MGNNSQPKFSQAFGEASLHHHRITRAELVASKARAIKNRHAHGGWFEDVDALHIKPAVPVGPLFHQFASLPAKPRALRRAKPVAAWQANRNGFGNPSMNKSFVASQRPMILEVRSQPRASPGAPWPRTNTAGLHSDPREWEHLCGARRHGQFHQFISCTWHRLASVPWHSFG